MKARRSLRIVFAVAVGVVAGAMSWITSDLLALERSQHEARADASHQETLRLALWRMDSWLGPEIAAETAPSTTHPQNVVRAVYECRERGEPVAVRGGDDASARIAAAVDVAAAKKRVVEVDERLRAISCEVPAPTTPAELTNNDYNSRARANLAQQVANAGANGMPRLASAGPLAPLWVAVPGSAPALVFLQLGPSELHVGNPGGGQGRGDRTILVHVTDWPTLRKGLLSQVADLLPAPSLRPVLAPAGDAERGFVLASAPIALDAPRPAAAAVAGLTPTRLTIGVAWCALAFAFVAVGVALRNTAELSERRSRFASSVTHELRTPLTTFRLYSEMLADGMVADPAQRQTYLDTLKSESTRLASLVENVLAYARVEEGRMPLRRERIAVADLLLRVQPVLDRRAKDAGTSLVVAAGDAASAVVDVDPDVVGQVLFNLVDNAAKYASVPPGRAIELSASKSGDTVRIAVRDHGPGIAEDRVRAAFTPFERAGRPAGDTVPGIGLGLALSRALARDLGGDLAYEPAPGGGACFVLTLRT